MWGETHLHTALSGDAFRGGSRPDLDEAYRFAGGETVTSNSGQPVKLVRPLGFFLIHAARDPMDTNLDRIQVVKGWRTQDSSLKEKVYNVAWSNNSVLNKSGILPLILLMLPKLVMSIVLALRNCRCVDRR